ncbi:MAG: periplasmic heavy metal sensor [Bacteroidales bacterium]|nr:periplasmic heavy metal sensor [Bacteroidales bacterium]
MNKTAIYIIVIIFLLVTNIATIVTTASLSRREQEKEEAAPVIELPRDSRLGYFHMQLGMRDDQRPAFNKYNSQFNMEAGQLSSEMRELRHRMVEEMASENPDTALLNQIAAEFGSLHEKMKKLTMEYYFNLKAVSDEMQRERLHFMFRDMLDPEGSIYGRGRAGEGRGMRRGGGRMQELIQQ